MTRSLRVLAGVAGWVLAVCGGIIFFGSAAALRRGSATFGPDAFAVAFYFAAAVAGVALIHRAWPGLCSRIARRAAAAVTSRPGVSNPLVHGLVIYAAAVPLLAVSGGGAVLVAAIAALVYAIASPVLIASQPRLWLHVPLSIVVGILLVAALPGTADALAHRRFGDDWMVMLGPVMLYPVALAAALVIRGARRIASRQSGTVGQ